MASWTIRRNVRGGIGIDLDGLTDKPARAGIAAFGRPGQQRHVGDLLGVTASRRKVRSASGAKAVTLR